MNPILICIIFIIIGGVFYPLAMMLNDTRKQKNKHKIQGKNIKKSEEGPEIQGEKKLDVSQDILEFDNIEVCNDDCALVRVNDNEYLGYLEVKGTPFNLLSYRERINLEESFGNLLNGISYNIQFYVPSRSLNLDTFSLRYEEKVKELGKKVEELEKSLSNANEKDYDYIYSNLMKANNQYEYAVKLLNYFIERNIDTKLLERRYYIVLNFIFDSSKYENELSKEEILQVAFNDIVNRADVIRNTLEKMKLSSKFLNGMEVAELLYSSYNKEDADNLRLSNAVAARYNHLYTTSSMYGSKDVVL